MRRTVVVVVFAAAVFAGCGDDETTTSACRTADPAVEAAARAHVGAPESQEGPRIEADVCQTGADEATATVTEVGVLDDSVRDVRHELELERRDGAWAVASEKKTQRCRDGRGHQDFSAEPCI